MALQVALSPHGESFVCAQRYLSTLTRRVEETLVLRMAPWNTTVLVVACIASMLSAHAVPRILDNTPPPGNTQLLMDHRNDLHADHLTVITAVPLANIQVLRNTILPRSVHHAIAKVLLAGLSLGGTEMQEHQGECTRLTTRCLCRDSTESRLPWPYHRSFRIVPPTETASSYRSKMTVFDHRILLTTFNHDNHNDRKSHQIDIVYG